MTDEFGPAYAGSYDALYGTKDYEAECAILEEMFEAYGRRPTRTILDLGSGTGRHAVLLAARGHEVVGIDRSSSMLALARERAATAGVVAEFREGDVRSVDVGARFDAVVLMFAVLGYQLSDVDVRSTLRSARRHLETGGLLVFDVWFGPAVVAEGPSDRVRRVRDGDAVIERHATGRLDLERHLCTVDYRLVITGSTATQTHETHIVRYFFEDEVHRFLEEANLELVRFTGFPEVDSEPTERTWNVLVVARAV